MHDRFWSKVHKTKKCWLWTAGKNQYGYGQLTKKLDNVNSVGAHRIAYIILIGEIPKGLVIDHLCRVRHCVNTEHMEVVTIAENVRRGESGLERARQQSAKTHCKNGHEYTEENTYITATYRYRKSQRACVACRKKRSKTQNENLRLARI